jgi:hypothetical protein
MLSNADGVRERIQRVNKPHWKISLSLNYSAYFWWSYCRDCSFSLTFYTGSRLLGARLNRYALPPTLQRREKKVRSYESIKNESEKSFFTMLETNARSENCGLEWLQNSKCYPNKGKANGLFSPTWNLFSFSPNAEALLSGDIHYERFCVSCAGGCWRSFVLCLMAIFMEKTRWMFQMTLRWYQVSYFRQFSGSTTLFTLKLHGTTKTSPCHPDD